MQGLGVYFAQARNAANQTILPNKDLGLTKSHHFVLSHNYLLTKNLKLKTEIYYQHLFSQMIMGVSFFPSDDSSNAKL
jgi:hypothetical protein